jgi:hypothetical protein
MYVCMYVSKKGRIISKYAGLGHRAGSTSYYNVLNFFS